MPFKHDLVMEKWYDGGDTQLTYRVHIVALAQMNFEPGCLICRVDASEGHDWGRAQCEDPIDEVPGLTTGGALPRRRSCRKALVGKLAEPRGFC